VNIEHTAKEHYLFWQYGHSGYRGVCNSKHCEFLIFPLQLCVIVFI